MSNDQNLGDSQPIYDVLGRVAALRQELQERSLLVYSGRQHLWPYWRKVYTDVWGLSTRAKNRLVGADIAPDEALFLSPKEFVSVRQLGQKGIAEILAKRRRFLDGKTCPICQQQTVVDVHGYSCCVDCEGFSQEELRGF